MSIRQKSEKTLPIIRRKANINFSNDLNNDCTEYRIHLIQFDTIIAH